MCVRACVPAFILMLKGKNSPFTCTFLSVHQNTRSRWSHQTNVEKWQWPLVWCGIFCVCVWDELQSVLYCACVCVCVCVCVGGMQDRWWNIKVCLYFLGVCIIKSPGVCAYPRLINKTIGSLTSIRLSRLHTPYCESDRRKQIWNAP